MAESTVFVVESDAAVCDSLCWLVESIGLECRTFSSALEFLSSARRAERGLACVVADARLPVISGLQLQQLLREMGIGWPFIVTSGYGNVSEAVEAMRGGALDYLEKPFAHGRLLRKIDEALQLSAGKQAPPHHPTHQQRRVHRRQVSRALFQHEPGNHVLTPVGENADGRRPSVADVTESACNGLNSDAHEP